MKYAYRIKLADTDAAGRLYFVSACRIAHEAFEHFMDVIGHGIDAMIKDGPVGLPVVHVEADYTAPLTLGQTISVDTAVTSVSEKSVTFLHVLYDARGRESARVTITHASVSARTGRAVHLPEELGRALQSG